MDIHKNARLTPHRRAELVRRVEIEGQTPKAVAAAFGVCERTVRKWVTRYQTEGPAGLRDRSSRPRRLYRPTPAAVVERVATVRRQRGTGQRIAAQVGVSPATVSRLRRRRGLSRGRDLQPAPPVRRYQREHPGELIHLDIKKLGRFRRPGPRVTGDRTGQSRSRGVGWEYVHVCVDDHSRLAVTQIRPDEKKHRAAAFLNDAVAYYRSPGFPVQRGMTDNGSGYQSRAFARACRALGLQPLRTKPDTPGPMGRPSASSRPLCGNGPTPEPASPPSSERSTCRAGSTPTTGTAPTAAGRPNRPSADSAQPGTTC